LSDEPKKRGRKRKYVTEEEIRAAARAKTACYREKNREKCREGCRQNSKRRKAERAIAEGREPGRVGNPVRRTPEERAAYRARWNAENADRVREQDAVRRRRYTRERAEREGRVLQKVGGDPKYTDQERLETRRAAALAYWAKNPDKRKELARQYYLDHPEEFQAKARNRRARKKDAGGTHTARDIEYLFGLQKGRCVFCLKPLLGRRFHVDHHTPLALGGSNDRSNLRLLHDRCNLSKGARDPAEHALRNGMLCW